MQPPLALIGSVRPERARALVHSVLAAGVSRERFQSVCCVRARCARACRVGDRLRLGHRRRTYPVARLGKRAR